MKLLISIGFVLILSCQIFGHGDEDHSGETKMISIAKGLMTKTATVGEFEIMLKFPEIEPDKLSHATIFVTKSATNEAVENAKVTLSIGENQISAKTTDNKGVFTLDLPAMAIGNEKISATVTVGGKPDKANLGTLEIVLHNHDSISEINIWAKTGLWLLGAILGAILIGFAIWFFLKRFKTEEIVST